jgi:tellurite methyltransferase
MVLRDNYGVARGAGIRLANRIIERIWCTRALHLLHFPCMLMASSLRDLLGSTDIYLIDQILKGRIAPGMSLLDAGCGGGRNLGYLMRSGTEVFGVDSSAEAIAAVRGLAARLAPDLPPENFRIEPVESLSFPDGRFDVVVSSAVLHFARDEAQWRAMLHQMWRVLRPGGMLFVRLASLVGMEQQARLIEGRRYHLPDGSQRFLVDAAMLHAEAAALGAVALEPLKTVVVDNMRAMSTWVVGKG